MATVTYKGKKKIITNNGTVQLSMNDNRILVYDTDKYRFIAGEKNDNTTKIQMTLPGESVLS